MLKKKWSISLDFHTNVLQSVNRREYEATHIDVMQHKSIVIFKLYHFETPISKYMLEQILGFKARKDSKHKNYVCVFNFMKTIILKQRKGK